MTAVRAIVAGLSLALAACSHSSLTLLSDEGGGHGAVAVLEANGKPVEAVIAQPESRTRLGSASPTARPLGARGLNPEQLALVTGLPPAPRNYTLYFVEGTTDLTEDSRPVLDELRSEVAARPGVEVEVTGHTDTVGSLEDNDALSLRRAEQILDVLASAGIERSLMTAVGRGEREPRQPTADNVESAVNRRVEVLVR